MPTFQIVEAKAWHCGAMSRILRYEHQKIVAMIGFNSHKELRSAFDDSFFKKAWLIDGKLAALGGVTGPALATYGYVWLAFSNAATKYPLAIIKEARLQLDQIMQTKRLLIAPMLEADEVSQRFAIFLGFVPATEKEYVLPASSRFGRKEIARQLKEREEIRVRIGAGYGRIMTYRQMEA